MKQLVETFQNTNVRIFEIKGSPFFSVLDVCKVLDISNSRDATSRLDKDDVGITDSIDSLGRKQKLTIINEGALYQLIFRSRKAEAKIFAKWVTHEVLPSIRKTGKYSISNTLSSKSIETRKMLTKEWEQMGIKEGWEYGKLTIQEYRSLKFKEGLRKKDFDEGQIKALLALEAMEMLNLHYNPVKGFLECKQSLIKTSKKVLEIKSDKIKNIGDK